jgi:hypothetical protein
MEVFKLWELRIGNWELEIGNDESGLSIKRCSSLKIFGPRASCKTDFKWEWFINSTMSHSNHGVG